jgi:hypothetical protein
LVLDLRQHGGVLRTLTLSLLFCFLCCRLVRVREGHQPGCLLFYLSAQSEALGVFLLQLLAHHRRRHLQLGLPLGSLTTESLQTE